MKKISEAEQEVMMMIWNAEEDTPITSSYILEMSGEEKGWKKTSVLTFLSRLVDKGYLSCKKEGKTNFYTPLISYETFTKKESKNILKKLYHNSLKNFVTSLYDGDELTNEDVNELKEFLDTISVERGNEK